MSKHSLGKARRSLRPKVQPPGQIIHDFGCPDPVLPAALHEQIFRRPAAACGQGPRLARLKGQKLRRIHMWTLMALPALL